MTNLSVIPGERELQQPPQADEFVRLFRLAEEKIKLVENLNQELSIPAINELRYAGHHMTEYLAGVEDAGEQLSKAENHCKRAIFDAVEAGVTHQLEVFREFKNDFRHLIISETIPHFADIETQAREAKKLILAPKSKTDSRAEYYEQCSIHLEKLREANEMLDSRREDLLKALKRLNRQTQIYYIAIATMFFTFAGIVLAVFNSGNPQEQLPLAGAAPVTAPPAAQETLAPALPAAK